MLTTGSSAGWAPIFSLFDRLAELRQDLDASATRHCWPGVGVASFPILAQLYFAEFFRSGAINEAPFNLIAAAMYASLVTKAAAGQKEIPNQGTVTDINMISTLPPYCDVMFVDNKSRALLRDIPRDYALPYSCKVFSPNTGADFIRYLTEIRDSVTPDRLKLIEEVCGPDPMKPQVVSMA